MISSDTCPRTTTVLVLLGLYYGIPWQRWDQHQAILFDLPGRKFHLFALATWPQDFIYLVGLLIIAALALFLYRARRAAVVWFYVPTGSVDRGLYVDGVKD